MHHASYIVCIPSGFPFSVNPAKHNEPAEPAPSVSPSMPDTLIMAGDELLFLFLLDVLLSATVLVSDVDNFAHFRLQLLGCGHFFMSTVSTNSPV